jgi:MoxR-like ATPase
MQDDFNQYRGNGAASAGSPTMSRGEAGSYLAPPSLAVAVNTAIAVEQPLLLTGEPGTGKTTLAWSIASELGLGEVLEFHTRSDHLAKDALYEFDNLARFYDAHRTSDAEAGAPIRNLEKYVRMRALGEAFESPTRRVVLIDEIDKAPRDFPNDLLDVIDKMAFKIDETGRVVTAKYRPVLVITSNRESQLPDPFLRRCVFHYIDFPSNAELEQIVKQRLGQDSIGETYIRRAIVRFRELREQPGLRKKPATHELITWLRVLARAGVPEADIERPLGDLFGKQTLLKHLDDINLFPMTESKA